MSSEAILLYNAGGQELLKRVDMHKAMNMLWRGVARILEADEGTFGGFERPKSLELVRYVVTKWRYQTTGKVPFSRMAVLRRDNFECAYCNKKGPEIVNTIDHVIPRSRWKSSGMSGTPTVWNNLVAACFSCNNKKNDRTPKEAGMKLRYLPTMPSFQEAYKLVHNRM